MCLGLSGRGNGLITRCLGHNHFLQGRALWHLVHWTGWLVTSTQAWLCHPLPACGEAHTHLLPRMLFHAVPGSLVQGRVPWKLVHFCRFFPLTWLEDRGCHHYQDNACIQPKGYRGSRAREVSRRIERSFSGPGLGSLGSKVWR